MKLRFWEYFAGAKSIRLSAACISDRGKRRTDNEDNFYFDGAYLSAESDGTEQCLTLEKEPDGSVLLAVFDGMGGGDYGEVASYEAAAAAAEFLRGETAEADAVPSYLTQLCETMNRRIFEQGQSLNAYQMGSTLAALFWCGNKLWVCNIGDSRVFGLHRRHLLQLSVDHTDEAFLRERGITNRKPYLTQYLGMDPNEILLVPAIRNYRAAAGDRFLVCSDGVTDMLSVQEIEMILRQEKTPESAAARLVQAALDNGGKDNITAIVCDILR